MVRDKFTACEREGGEASLGNTRRCLLSADGVGNTDCIFLLNITTRARLAWSGETEDFTDGVVDKPEGTFLVNNTDIGAMEVAQLGISHGSLESHSSDMGTSGDVGMVFRIFTWAERAFRVGGSRVSAATSSGGVVATQQGDVSLFDEAESLLRLLVLG